MKYQTRKAMAIITEECYYAESLQLIPGYSKEKKPSFEAGNFFSIKEHGNWHKCTHEHAEEILGIHKDALHVKILNVSISRIYEELDQYMDNKAYYQFWFPNGCRVFWDDPSSHWCVSFSHRIKSN